LSNGASVNIRGADKFTFDVGGDMLSNKDGEKYNFSEFVTEILGLSKVPAVGEAPISGGAVNISLNKLPYIIKISLMTLQIELLEKIWVMEDI